MDPNEMAQISHERQQALENGVEVDIRFHLEPGCDIDAFIHEIGSNLEDCWVAVPLQNDGFANMLPDYTRQQFFVG